MSIDGDGVSELVDCYKYSEDGYKLISMKRGEKYDLVKYSDKYTMEEHLRDKYNVNDEISGVYEGKDGIQTFVIAYSDYALGNRKGIVKWEHDDESYWNISSIGWEEDVNSPSSYGLDIYIDYVGAGKVKKAYNFNKYTNYFSGIMVYNDEIMKSISINANKKDGTLGSIVDSEEKMEKVRNITIEDLIKDINYLEEIYR